jgi:hypothetical protein
MSAAAQIAAVLGCLLPLILLMTLVRGASAKPQPVRVIARQPDPRR